MAKSVVVAFEGVEHKVKMLRHRENAAWRKKLEEPFGELVTRMDEFPNVEINDMKAIGRLVRTMSGTLLRSIDIVAELVIAYAPELNEVIENAFEDEILDAFISILGLAYPFGAILPRIQKLGSKLSAGGSGSKAR